MKKMLCVILCMLLALPCALCETAAGDSVAENAPYEGAWTDIGGGLEVYLPTDWELSDGTFYDFSAYWHHYSGQSCTLKTQKTSKQFESIEAMCKAYAMLRAEIMEINGFRLVDKLKNVAEAQDAGVKNWQWLADDGAAWLLEFEMKSDFDELTEETKAMGEYVLASLRKIAQ